MKRITDRLPKLNAQGIAHFIAPLVIVLAVGVIGTFMLVASHANSVSRKSYLVVYSEQGAYDSVRIKLAGTSGEGKTCGGSLASGSLVKKLPGANKKTSQYPPLKLVCSALGGTGSYEISYGKNNDFSTTATMVAVDVDKGYCTFVHADPTKVNKVKYENGKCKNSQQENDTPTKSDVVIRLLPSINKTKRQFTGYVDMAVPGKNVTRAQCTGQINLVYTRAHEPGVEHTQALPIKYVGSKTSKSKQSYCVARIAAQQQAKLPTDTYVLKAKFPGSPYFNPIDSAVSTQFVGPN